MRRDISLISVLTFVTASLIFISGEMSELFSSRSWISALAWSSASVTALSSLDSCDTFLLAALNVSCTDCSSRSFARYSSTCSVNCCPSVCSRFWMRSTDLARSSPMRSSICFTSGYILSTALSSVVAFSTRARQSRTSSERYCNIGATRSTSSAHTSADTCGVIISAAPPCAPRLTPLLPTKSSSSDSESMAMLSSIASGSSSATGASSSPTRSSMSVRGAGYSMERNPKPRDSSARSASRCRIVSTPSPWPGRMRFGGMPLTFRLMARSSLSRLVDDAFGSSNCPGASKSFRPAMLSIQAHRDVK
mmetsp:Transcript_36407/g.112162  ORF Transcript_36407/g.112162 Transcript_36407/m.112162 type:complete len:307 (+) Transcript_36407:245-1165(+)